MTDENQMGRCPAVYQGYTIQLKYVNSNIERTKIVQVHNFNLLINISQFNFSVE